MSFLKNLQAKVLLAALIPGSMILIIVAIIALFQYGATVLKIVEERDEQLARLTAHQLSDTLVRHTRILETVASAADVRPLDTVSDHLYIAMDRGYLEPYDGGVTLYDRIGIPIWSSLRADTSELPRYHAIDTIEASRTSTYSDVFTDPGSGRDSIRFSVPVLNDKQEFVGVGGWNRCVRRHTYERSSFGLPAHSIGDGGPHIPRRRYGTVNLP